MNLKNFVEAQANNEIDWESNTLRYLHRRFSLEVQAFRNAQVARWTRSVAIVACVWLLVISANGYGQILGQGCALTLPSNVGGGCDYLNNQFSQGGVQLRWATEDSRSRFGIDASGNVRIAGRVYLIGSNGLTEGTGVYQFRVQDVTFEYRGLYVAINCEANTRCITTQSTGSTFAIELLLNGDPVVHRGVIASLIRIGIRQYP